ncbi:MAG: hypothetical protein D6784_06615 [Chloroflexi bacterium]|nr:MAG: hypothetical protein D6784_06615 [Chloroflexota bacterium]
MVFDDVKAKELLKQAIVELLQEQRDLFYEVLLEAIEEVGLANAIREGKETGFVDEKEILALLDETNGDQV